jgi:hypothetical protein
MEAAMLKEKIIAELVREPFVPLRLHLRNGKTFDIPFREVAYVLRSSVVLFIGRKQGTHEAKGHTEYIFEDILRIEHRPARPRRRKAS